MSFRLHVLDPGGYRPSAPILNALRSAAGEGGSRGDELVVHQCRTRGLLRFDGRLTKTGEHLVKCYRGRR